MSPPNAKAKEVLGWLAKAKRDLTIAGMNLASEPAITDDAMFHCQQAVEKSLKGFLSLHDCPFKKTHIIGEIAQQVLQIAPELEEVLREATELTPYATMFRYPGEIDLPQLDDARSALRLATRVYEALLSRIPLESHPG